MSQQGPGSSGTPPQPGTPPPPYRDPHLSGSRKLRRSRTDRKFAGVAGGLAEYLGVDSNFMRVAFVIVSVFFLAVFIGVVLYALAAVVIPEEGDDAAIGGPFRDIFSGRPWHDWDRTARSWAIVLGALTLAVLWSVGEGPGLHWRALPVLLLLAGLALWAVTRFGHGPGWPNPPANWPIFTRRPPDGTGPHGAAASPPGGTSPSPTAPPTGPQTGATGDASGGGYPGGGFSAAAGPAAPGGFSAAAGPAAPGGFTSAVGPTSTLGFSGSASVPRAAGASGPPETSDWVQAQSAAAGWAQEQLAAAGVPPSPPPPAGTTQVAPWSTGPRPQRRVGPSSAAVITGLLLLVVIAAVTVARR
jgi:phage shock protein PspC (stress-responsive transcriptional regulator)